MMVTFADVAAVEDTVVTIWIKGEREPVRGTIEMLGVDSVRVDSPYSGYRRAELPLASIVDIQNGDTNIPFT